MRVLLYTLWAAADLEGQEAMRTVEQDKQDVAEVIEQYRLGFAILDVATLTTIWDQRYDNIIYIPLEAAHPVRGWAAVE
jgi:hypothetical protein